MKKGTAGFVLTVLISFFSSSLLRANFGLARLKQLNQQYQLAYCHYRKGCYDEKCDQTELDNRFQAFRQALVRYQITLNSSPSLAVKVDMPMVTTPIGGSNRRSFPIGRNPSIYPGKIESPPPANVRETPDIGIRPCEPVGPGLIEDTGSIMPAVEPPATSSVSD